MTTLEDLEKERFQWLQSLEVDDRVYVISWVRIGENLKEEWIHPAKIVKITPKMIKVQNTFDARTTKESITFSKVSGSERGGIYEIYPSQQAITELASMNNLVREIKNFPFHQLTKEKIASVMSLLAS